MAQLDKKIQLKINNLIDEGSEEYDKGDLNKAIESLKLAWSELPDTKFGYDDSYHIARYIVIISMELKIFSQALEWGLVVQKCDPERPDIGEKEFLLGQVFFESGDLEKAKFYLNIASQKSDNLCFIEQDPKYQKLINP